MACRFDVFQIGDMVQNLATFPSHLEGRLIRPLDHGYWELEITVIESFSHLVGDRVEIRESYLRRL